ncbi:alpha-2B adrenergic receptor [Mugil cephalus]|uniref:alpha-2B adrenergic receptor n=1 Tax=Mugil cephalus TaxID=48193 RepID=UPI001FB5B911|nr:alpha-2B adrenergic receptor [Mugil cephalus]
MDAPCLRELGGLPNKNISLISGARPCNRSTVRSSYTPQGTAALAIGITFMMIVTIVGNILVIIAVLTSRSLRGAHNLFLVSLAAADILVATLVIPFSLANELQGYWAFSSIWCEIYLALDVLFCTSSIVHLCAIALDRYLSISRPLSYGAKRTPLRIKAAIIVVWLISAIISFPPLLTLDKSAGGEEECELNDERWYILYSTIGSFFAPCVIMILVYVRIYQIAKKHTRCPPGQKHKAAGEGDTSATTPGKPAATCQPEQQGGATSSRWEKVLNKKTTKASLQKQPPSPPHCDDQNLSAVPQKHPNNRVAALPDTTSSFGSDLETAEERVPAEGDDQNEENSDEATVGPSQSEGLQMEAVNLAGRCKNTMATPSGTKLAPEEQPKTQGTPMSRRKALVNREKRFTVVLAVVMGVFVVCWFPFFFSYSLQAVCPETCDIPKPLFKFFFWIGYCNSCLNPVIYTIFNKDFRKAFKRILSRDTKGTFF